MAARVDVPGIGPMYFPDEMSDDEIRAQVQGMSRREERSLPDESIRPTSLGRRGAPGFSEDKAFSYLQGSGMFDAHHTAGIIGNLYQESGLDPNAINPKSGAYGIGQWLGPRKRALFDYALERGTHPSDPYLQMDFLMHELRGSENKAYQQLLGAGSPEDAAIAFSKGFERAGAEESRDSARARRAQSVFGRFGGQGAGPAPTDELQFDPREIPLADLAKAGMYRGAQNIFSGVTDVLPSMAARQFGFDDYAQQQEAERAQALRDIQENYPSYFPDLESVTDVPSGMGWLAERVGEQLPTLPAAIGPGLVGRVGAAALGRAAATRAIPEIAAERGLVGEAAEALAQTPAAERLVGMAGRRAGEAGLTAGLTAGSALVNIPETYEQIYKETGEFHPAIAAGFGTLKAGLDTVFNQRLLRQLTPGGKDLLAAKIAQESDLPISFKKAFLKEAGKNFATEGGTEAAQDFIDSLAAQAAGSKEALLSKEHINSWLESGLVGGIVGGGLGAPGAALEASRIKAERQAGIDKRESNKELAEQQRIADEQARFNQQQLEREAAYQQGIEMGPAPETRLLPPPSDFSVTREGIALGGGDRGAYEAGVAEATSQEQRQRDLLAQQGITYPAQSTLSQYEQQRGEPTQLDMFPAEKAAAEGAARRGIAPYAQPAAEEITPAEAQFDPVISPDRLKSAGLTPQSGFFKELVGKDLSKPRDLNAVKKIISKVQQNPILAQSTKDGVRSLYTQAMAMYGKQGEMFTPTGRVKKGVSGARVPTRVVGGGGGAGVQVPSGPEGAAPAGGAGIPEQAGMATSEPVATGSQRGEAAQPSALAPEFALPNIPPVQIGESPASIDQKLDAWDEYRSKLNKARVNGQISVNDWLDLYKKANAAASQILEVKHSPEYEAAADIADSIEAAKKLADRGRGEVIWSEGPLHLVKTHNEDGDTWYRVVKGKYLPRFLEDIDPYDPNSKFTLEDSMKLNAAKDAHEAEDAERHAREPFVKFGIDGLAFSDSIPNEIRSIISEWKRLLNIKSNVYIGTFADAKRDYKNFTGPHKVIGGIDQGDASGKTRRMEDGSRLILMEPERSTIANLETLAHELGHIHEKEMFNNAPQAVRDAIRKDFETWLANRKGKTAREFIRSLRARKVGQLTIPNMPRKGEFPAENISSYKSYFSSFGEWYADQVSRWATTSEKPVSVVEKYFKRLADSIKRFFAQLQNAGYLPSNAVKKYLDSIAEDATNNPPLLDNPDTQDTDIQKMSRKVEERKGAKPIDFSSPNGPFQTVKGMDRFINGTPVFGESQKGILSDAINGASDTARSAILGFLPTHALSDLASRYFPPGVAEAYHAGLRSLDGYLHKLTEKSVDVVMHKYRNARRVSAKQNDLFNKVVNQSTIYEVDPSDPSSIANATKFSMGYVLFNPDGTERGKEIKYFDTAEQRSAAIKAYNQNRPDHEKAFVVKDPDVGTREAAQRITAMYRRLRPEWKDLYKAMRNSNSEMLKTFKDSLCERIDEASNLDEEARIVFKKSILTRLAEAGMIHPYFTLGREGNHWLAAEVPNQYGAYESFVTAFQDTLSRSKMETELKNSVYKHEFKKNLERGMGKQEAQQAAYDTALQNVRIYSNAQEIDYRRMPAGSVINDILGVIEKRKPGRAQGESDEAYRDRVRRFDEVEKDIMQMVINSLPETAFVKSLQKRKKTAGYSEDAVNVYERKTRSTARQISNLRFKPKVNASLDAMRNYANLLGRGQEEVKDPNTGEILQERVVPRDNKVQVDFLNEFTKHSNAAFNPSERFISSTIRSALFGGTLGFNVSSGLIALSNLPMIVFPYLGSEYGMSATNKAMGEAYRVVRNSGNSRKATAFGSENASDVREEKMASGWSFGNYSPTSKEGRKYATLLEIASAAGQLNRSQLYENLMGSARTTSLDKFNAMSGWMLHTAERFNREVTLIAAYDLELAKLKKEGITGQEAEIRAANKAVYAAEMANGSIAQSSAPRFAQSGLGSIVYMYKRFGATQYYLQAKTLYDSLKGEQDPKVRKMLTNRFWSLTGATAVMSGLQGLPMFGFAAMLYNLFKDDDDDDFNTVARKGLNELFYNGPIEYLTGLSVANRMGLSNLIIKEPRSSGESSSFSQTLLDSFGGPLPSMVDRFNRGIDKIQKGNIERGIEDLMPVAAANAMKAARYLIQGEARTLRGDTIYDDIGPGSAMATLFGFTPSEVARRMEFNAKEKGLSKAIQAKDSNIKGRYYKAWREHDAEGMRDAKRMLVELGAKHPDLGYNAGTVGKIMQDTVKLHEAHTKRMLMGQEYPKKHLRSVHQSMKDLDIEP